MSLISLIYTFDIQKGMFVPLAQVFLTEHTEKLPVFRAERTPCINYVHSGEDVHSQSVTSPFPVKTCIPGDDESQN